MPASSGMTATGRPDPHASARVHAGSCVPLHASPRMIRGVRALPRTIWLVAAISLFNDAASDMIYPLVPLYLATVLMAGPKALGLIEGVAEAVSSLLKLFAGAL